MDKVSKASSTLRRNLTNLAITFPSLERISEAADLIVTNYKKRGYLRERILQIKIEDKNGTLRPVIRQGSLTDKGLERFSTQSRDLMKGWPKKDMANFLGYATTDKRVDQVANNMSKAIRKAFGIMSGWDGNGKFRIYSLKELAKKENRRAGLQINIRDKAREDAEALQSRGKNPKAQLAIQSTMWEALEDDSD